MSKIDNYVARIADLAERMKINGKTLECLIPSASYAQANKICKGEVPKGIEEPEYRAVLLVLKEAEKLDLLPVSPRSRTLAVLAVTARSILEEERCIAYEEALEDGEQGQELITEVSEDSSIMYLSRVVAGLLRIVEGDEQEEEHDD